MTNAPAPIIILLPFDAGSPKEARRMKPPIYPAKRCEQWPHHQAIPRYVPPASLIEEIKRRGKEVLEATRHQARHPATDPTSPPLKRSRAELSKR